MKRKNIFLCIVISLLCITQFSKAQRGYNPHYRNIFILLEDKKIESRISTDKNTKIDSRLIYFWYDNSLVHYTQGNYSRYLLDGKYIEYYLPSNNLLVKGNFRRGLKNRYWFEWYPDGTLKSKAKWYRGRLNGKTYSYNTDGELKKIEKYSEGKLNGKSHKIDSSVVITTIYKDGRKVVRRGLLSDRQSARDSVSTVNGKGRFQDFFGLFKKKRSHPQK